VTALTPISGPSAGGTVVAVTGSGFTAGATVRFGSVAAGAVTVGSPTGLTATAPPGTSTVHVTVTTAGGTSATGPADLWTPTFATNGYAAGLTASGPTAAAGGSVTLTATSNKNLSATPYYLCVYDVVTGVRLLRSGPGGTVSFTVSQSVPGAHRYVAQIDNGASPAAAVQAVATPVVVTWS
jgi:hypothetical protein